MRSQRTDSAPTADEPIVNVAEGGTARNEEEGGHVAWSLPLLEPGTSPKDSKGELCGGGYPRLASSSS